jgi:hypothetical protein
MSKKLNIQDCIESAAKLIKIGVRRPLVVYAVMEEGYDIKKSNLIVQWATEMAKNDLDNSKVIKRI